MADIFQDDIRRRRLGRQEVEVARNNTGIWKSSEMTPAGHVKGDTRVDVGCQDFLQGINAGHFAEPKSTNVFLAFPPKLSILVLIDNVFT